MLFSVIVPVYKVEPYLKECVDSILNQTLRDFELILVDDGSPDRCPEICDQYAARDARVRVIHKENGGLVSARQAGISLAQGTYAVNIDSDDWIEPNMLERAKLLLEETQADMVSFGVKYENQEQAQIVTEPLKEGLYDREKLACEIYPKILLGKDAGHMLYYLCGKVFRLDKLRPCQMAVDRRISFGEDVTCLTQYYLSAQSVYIAEIPMYHCRVRAGSDSRNFRVIQFAQLAYGISALRRFQPNQVNDYSEQVDRYGCFSCFVLLVTAAQTGAAHRLGQIKKALREPALQETISRAEFQNQTIKTRLALFLLKKNWIHLDYWMLWACERLKALCGR